MKQNTNSICLYIKISISPYFSISPLGALLGLQGPTVIAVESVARVRTSTQNKHAKSEDKPLQIQL